MADNFKDREKSFESKYAHDAEVQFKVDARRNRLLGEWAAELLGKEGDEKAAYAKEVVKADFEEAGDDDVLRKVAGDLGEKVPTAEIRAKMDALMVTAKEQVMTELK
ncbi:MAG: DUF1476 domain-containing protein [Jannaschia helgolandensis]|jgi:hypothetical protein|uniref:DUF1476 domain-containing protein n=1 Tax=Jannaschia helgolandensis TaxID=188906 RepID=A0A1H7MM10_9RHOB|nr:DUF1476 domain-containing protein [Jannaschia helgolandensis]SEL12263.1 hypothetical protein SAMN04488526_1991 [Jannaschia helgolandensis]|tara:strand:+ start:1046 stop:1366 length:321 start_codon:yes stop_codon:yes gene_type:complete